MFRGLAATALFLACVITSCTALKCYKCHYSEAHPFEEDNPLNCADPFNPAGIDIVEHIGNGPITIPCAACTTSVTLGTLDGQVITERECAPRAPSPAGGLTVCTMDLCNGAPGVPAFTTRAAIAPTLATNSSGGVSTATAVSTDGVSVGAANVTSVTSVTGAGNNGSTKRIPLSSAIAATLILLCVL
ncbi:hypothetical protein BV898_18450 [Hypsibius exemplaris]|uniref:UPAR/Ly6 domain-containing protein n=1 Tax=Hypsibius exemplaris TaxID=2072580 RepID=A0A9X6NJC0_HYPEX|nr:hypothetical protein BV898_18450 [Hypsibius exemplaris]